MASKSTLLERTESVADRLLPPLMQEMNRTGHAGHCIYVARVIDRIFGHFGVQSEALCVDYEFANSAAVQQMESGESLKPPSTIVRTGHDDFDGYSHHVVTLVRDEGTALLLDPTIIQIEHYLPSARIPPIRLVLPWPRRDPLPLDLPGGRLTYSFRPHDSSFEDDSQWADVADADARAEAVLSLMEG